MIRNKTRNPLFFGFPSYTEPTRVIGVIELVIDQEYGIHARNSGYTPEFSDRRRNHSSSVSSGRSGVGVSSSSISIGRGGWIRSSGSSGINKVQRGDLQKELAQRGQQLGSTGVRMSSTRRKNGKRNRGRKGQSNRLATGMDQSNTEGMGNQKSRRNGSAWGRNRPGGQGVKPPNRS